MTLHRHIFTGLLTCILYIGTVAQEPLIDDFYKEIKKYNVSALLTADSILIEDREGGKEMSKSSEPLGYVGEDYQRFQIHFISVEKSKTNPYVYSLYGKTKVKDNICAFKGTLRIIEAREFRASDMPTYKQGFAMCEVNLYEDSTLSSSGLIRGKLKSEFLIDNKGRFRYDALNFSADGFFNNQFVGTWTSYRTGTSKKCNWGDYRIPESGDLDIGVGEFSIDEKFVNNGWQNYKLAWGTSPETSEVEKARQMEKEEWWK
jgi:hypothetical protein